MNAQLSLTERSSASIGADGTVRLWQSRDGNRPGPRPPVAAEPTSRLVFAADGTPSPPLPRSARFSCGTSTRGLRARFVVTARRYRRWPSRATASRLGLGRALDAPHACGSWPAMRCVRCVRPHHEPVRSVAITARRTT